MIELTLKLLLLELDTANKSAARAASAAGSGTQEDAARLRDAIGRQSSVVLALSSYAARLAESASIGGPVGPMLSGVSVAGTGGSVGPMLSGVPVTGTAGSASEEPHAVAEWNGLSSGGPIHIDPPRFKLVLYSDGSMETHRNGEFFSEVVASPSGRTGGGVLIGTGGVGTAEWAAKFSKCPRAQGHAHPDGSVDATHGEHRWPHPTSCALCGIGWYEAQGTVAPGAVSVTGGTHNGGGSVPIENGGRWPDGGVPGLGRDGQPAGGDISLNGGGDGAKSNHPKPFVVGEKVHVKLGDGLYTVGEVVGLSGPEGWSPIVRYFTSEGKNERSLPLECIFRGPLNDGFVTIPGGPVLGAVEGSLS